MSTVVVSLDVLSARPDLTNTPEMYFVAGTNFTNDGYAFTSGGSKALYFKLGADLYGTGNITLDLQWMSRSGSTTGNVQWVAALAAITAGDAQSIETKAFATSQNATTTVNSTAKGDTLTSISIVNLDSVSAGDVVWIKLTRGTDTMTGDAVLIKPTVSYSDGNSGSPGSGDVVGPASATTTAIARFNGTTGKLIQNSAVSLDSSGNFTGAGTYNGNPVKYWQCVALSASAATTSTTQTAISGLSMSYPAAGTYVFEFMVDESASATALMSVAVTATGGTITNFAMNMAAALSLTTGAFPPTVTTSGTATTNTSVSRSITTRIPNIVRGSFTTTASGTLSITHAASAGTMTANVGSYGRINQV